MKLRFKKGANSASDISQSGNDPHHQASLRSSMNLADRVTFDADFHYVGVLANPYVPDYGELNLRLGWQITDSVELSVSGFNLIHDRHLEYADSTSDLIKRSFFIDSRWKF